MIGISKTNQNAFMRINTTYLVLERLFVSLTEQESMFEEDDAGPQMVLKDESLSV